jgi:hypothetical protein
MCVASKVLWFGTYSQTSSDPAHSEQPHPDLSNRKHHSTKPHNLIQCNRIPLLHPTSSVTKVQINFGHLGVVTAIHVSIDGAVYKDITASSLLCVTGHKYPSFGPQSISHSNSEFSPSPWKVNWCHPIGINPWYVAKADAYGRNPLDCIPRLHSWWSLVKQKIYYIPKEPD